jgi:hypothetical protein
MPGHSKGPPSAGAGLSGHSESSLNTPDTPKKKRRQDAAHFPIADGRDVLGTVDLIDGAYVATDAAGKVVGKFASMKAAPASFTEEAAR